uniref:RNase H type-1 domain-containing protein n=1 Tax=Macaca fascicularis TaxID=9541 RepID=A0A7N9CL89_MACFA
MVQTYAARKDLRETPLENPDWTLFTYGSSFIEQGVHKAGYAVVTLNDVIGSVPLIPGTITQLAELIALTRALELNKRNVTNICIDSKYAFLVLHAHAAIWKERHFLTANGSPIKYHQEINRSLSSVFFPQEVAVMHCKGRQNGTDEIAEGNELADQATTSMARKPQSINTSEAPLNWKGSLRESKSQYLPAEIEWVIS